MTAYERGHSSGIASKARNILIKHLKEDFAMYVEDVEMLTVEEVLKAEGIRHNAMWRLLIRRKLKGYRNG